jgi:hypothetical protein
VKYTVAKDCDWKTFSAKAAPAGAGEAAVIAAADLKTDDGEPLPAEVVAELVRRKALVPVEAPAKKGKAKADDTPKGD